MPTKRIVQLTDRDGNDVYPVIASEVPDLTNYATTTFVDESIDNVASFYVTKDTSGNDFATAAELEEATTFYNCCDQRTPTQNDYCMVQADETHNGAMCRYMYNDTTNAWEYQYTVTEPICDAGSATQPIYVDNGTPIPITYTLEKSVPSDAVFTDTTNYTELNNKPSVNSVSLSGNKTSSDLGLAAADHTHDDEYLDKIFTVVITGNDDDGYVADKTVAEINEANAAGKLCRLRKNQHYYDLVLVDGMDASFSQMHGRDMEYFHIHYGGEVLHEKTALTEYPSSGEIGQILKKTQYSVEWSDMPMDADKADKTTVDNHIADTTKHITSTERTNWNDANSKKHTHSNKSILDATTVAFTGYQDISGKADVTYVDTEVAKKANSSHTHTISNVTNLQTTLDGKAAAFHTHTKSNITDFAHTHDDRYYTESEVNTALSAKADLEDGKVPASQLPSYVDDVLEFSASSQFPTTGESGKIYIAQDTNLTYRWAGTGYSEISPSIALGETSSTAYRGDRGKAAYDHISDTTKHITSTERTAWNSKASGSHTHDDRYYTETETNTLLGDKADSDDLTSHTGNTTSHITSTERTNWNDANTKKHSHSNKSILDATTVAFTGHQDISSKADVGDSYTKDEDDALLNAKANTSHTHTKSQISDFPTSMAPSAHKQAYTSDECVSYSSDVNTIGVTPAAVKKAIGLFDPKAHTHSAATQSANGFMASTDKTKLDGVATGATNVVESTVSGWGFTKNTGTYSKPTSGIPKADLVSAVQTSLGKADSALQSHQDISGKENASNKVTSVSSSSTDTQYPSAKALYTGLLGKANASHTHTKSQITDFPTSMTPTAHSHTATEITSGTLAVARGGTGNTSVDTVPTADSTKMVTSGGVKTALDGKAATSHTHTKSQITDFPSSLPASDVYNWAKASAKPTYTASEVGALSTSLKGANSGLAELDSSGKVPSTQLPSYVDDVVEYTALANFPTTGETGKIYIDQTTNKTYRWSGSAYIEISASLSLGETSSTAYRGDRGKTAYDHSQATHAPTNAQANQNAFSNVTVGSTTIAADAVTDTLTLVAGSNVTLTPDATNDKVTIASTNTTYSAATTSVAGLMSAADKTKLNGIESISNTTINALT